MEGNNKKIKNALIAVAVLVVVILAAVTGVLLQRDDVITYYGIRSWRLIFLVLIVLLLVAAVCGGIVLTLYYQSRNRMIKAQAMSAAQKEEQDEAEKRRKAKLSVKGDLDARTVKELLMEESRGRWSFAYELIYECVEQMEQMDSYQDRLKNLLMNNGADALTNTEDLLNQVEQYLCRNVRNVLNFMEVADNDSSDQVRVRLMTCKDENQKLLAQTRDFIYAMADFLNNQSGKADMRMLESYRNTILESIREGEE